MERKPIDHKMLRRSDLFGYWLRLKRLGFVRDWQITSTMPAKGVWLHNEWQFRHPQDRRQIRFKVIKFQSGRTRYIMECGLPGKELALRSSKVCWSHLETPFLNYFQQDQPLQLQRLGQQKSSVQEWLQAQAVAAAKAKSANKPKRKK